MRSRQHGILERAFLRGCAWFRRWRPQASDHSIWLNATYSFAFTLMALGFLAITALSLAFRDHIPAEFNPIFSKARWMPVPFVVGAVATFLAVEHATRKYKHDVGDAQRYMRSWDLAMWALQLVITVAAIAVSGVLTAAAWDR